MSKLEQFSIIFLGFWIFVVLWIRMGFFVGIPIGWLTLPLAFMVYGIVVTLVYTVRGAADTQPLALFAPVLWFIGSVVCLSIVSIGLARTYDTSWDGQGYHQSAVIALAHKWNPVRQPEIQFVQRLPSQIFAEGYPSALWEIEASIYRLTGRINTAKVVNIAMALLAGCMLYTLLRKLTLSPLFSSVVTYIVVLQPVYLLQVLTFMEDGFGYQLLLVSITSLALVAVFPQMYWTMAMFMMSQVLLVTTKYNLLPAALMLSSIFILLVINRLLSRIYVINRVSVGVSTLTLLMCLVFAYIPYIRNQLAYGAMFYPTNIPELMGSVKYNNVPNNLQESSKLSLLFYGIYSQAQSRESGDPRSETNVATLKIPFSFTLEELRASAELYNNRVGGGGPLYGGLVTLSLLLLVFMYFKMDTIQERYTIYASLLCVSLLVVLALVAPTPNLMRYVNQMQLLPFAVVVPVYAMFKQPLIRRYCQLLIGLSAVNVLLFYGAIVHKNIWETEQMNTQLTQMRESGNRYQVKAQQFYSSYILLHEQGVPYEVVNHLGCSQPDTLFASSTTTEYCANQQLSQK